MIENDSYDPRMTTLGSLVKVTVAFDLDAAVRHIEQVATGLAASIGGTTLGDPSSVRAAIVGWVNQDDDAHEMCSLVACRTPLHPGPCKGWKGTLHQVSPHIWKQIEEERVAKANARRVKKIADLKAQGKPIPRRLLAEIKPKPAPGSGAAGAHPANRATPSPLGKVNQQADLTGGQAHQASTAINQAAGIKPNTANLPTGPKGKKPTVAGRGPAFVITQSKVTDHYKLDKASKITQQEWDSLSPADQKAIRDELEAIKVRGFGPQQTRADQLLAKLTPTPTLGATSKPKAPAAPATPNPTPGKVSLGQALKNHVPVVKTATQVGGPPPPGPSAAPKADPLAKVKADIVAKAKASGHKPVVQTATQVTPGTPGTSAQGRAAAVRQADAALAITEALHGPQRTDKAKLATFMDMASAKGDIKSDPKFRTLVDRLAQNALSKAHAEGMPGLGHGANDAGITEFNHQIRDHIADGKPGLPPLVQKLVDHRKSKAAGNAPAPSAPAAPSKPSTPAPSTPGSKPQPPAAPAVFPAHVQQARAVAGRAAGRPTAKAHMEAYGKLTKADFDQLDANTQRTIRDDLANASAKFLDPKKKQDARDLLNRFGSRHTSPAPGAPPVHAHPKGYSDPQAEAVKAATSGTTPIGDVFKAVARLTPDQVGKLDDADKKAVVGRLDFVAGHRMAKPEDRAKAAAYSRIITNGPASSPKPGDHTQSIGELHAHEEKTGSAVKAAALKAAVTKANLTPGTTVHDQVKDLGGLTRAQFDSLPDTDQRKILDTLQALHREHAGNIGAVADAAEKAITEYTGDHPAMHRLKTAEADFRAGKITGDVVYHEFLTARVQANTAPVGTIRTALRAKTDAEAARIARDNPKLPLYGRVRMLGDPKYGTPTYDAISLAGMKHNWEPAPRFNGHDLQAVFKATDDDLKNVDPIHVQAIRELRSHLLETGLKGQPGTGSPWSASTRREAVRAALGTSKGGEVPSDRLSAFFELSPGAQDAIKKVVTDQVLNGSSDHEKLEAWVTNRALNGSQPLAGARRDAVLAATDKYGVLSGKMDAYRKLDPADFQSLPDFARRAITSDIIDAQVRASRGGAVTPYTPLDNALKVMPNALAAHLDGTRPTYGDRDSRNASDLALYGTKIVQPSSRVEAYTRLAPATVQRMPVDVQIAMEADLKAIENDASLPLQTRYDAAMVGHIFHPGSATKLTPKQVSAAQGADLHPVTMYSDTSAFGTFHQLDKADYDALPSVFQEAIDARIAHSPGSAAQILNAKFHPGAAHANNPSGMAPTTAQASVPPHVQKALDVIYGVDPKSHTMASQLSAYGGLKGNDFQQLNAQEQNQVLADLSFIQTTAKGPSATKAKLLIDRFTPAGTPSGQQPPNPPIIPPAGSVAGQVRYATPLKGLEKSKNPGVSGDDWIYPPGHPKVWGKYGAAGLLIKHVDPNTGEERFLMVQRGPRISDPGKWTFPGGAIESKETPHEGATRETIEELGLKDDQFKDALVHGDHTYSIPGHPWKYTTVAAQVTSQFKPDLSSWHARQETSDAKWMTLAEIRALDSSGKLHGPIAGGKLEQNVISLYPQGAAAGTGKLGQVARPGPVTKRQGRLTMPAGGRQAPASFNAWPHAHKPSTGKNLIADKTAMDAQRQKIKTDRKLYDGKTADGRLAAIGAQQGFDATPTVLDKKEIDRLLATGDYIEAWRGVSGAGGGWSARSRGGSGGKTAAQINEEMRTGTAYYGKGIFGNGYYLATRRSVAEQYSDRTSGSIVRILIPKSAVTQKYDKVSKESFARSSRSSKVKGGAAYGETSTFWDPGRYAAGLGLDGIEIEAHHVSPTGGARHVASSGKPAFNWLNRSVLIIQKEPG